MATLREYFFKELEGWGVHNDLTLTFRDGSKATLVERTSFDEKAGVNFVSYFFPEGTFKLEIAEELLKRPDDTIKRATDGVRTFMSHPVLDPDGIDPATQPFSGRVFLFIDDYLTPAVRKYLFDRAPALGLRLQLRDRSAADFLTSYEQPWAFISHDSKDKTDIAKPLAEKLTTMLCPVWYDEYSLKVGQSLRESIDKGLRDARKCILILSPNFLANDGWSKAEFNAVMGLHINGGGSVILPIWHNVTRDEVAEYSPLVADIVGLKSELGIDELARRLFLEIRPTST